MATSVGLATRGVIASGSSSLSLATRGLESFSGSILGIDPFLDPLLPLHVTQLVAGVQVRVSLKGGFHMVPKITKKGNFLVPGNKKGRRKGNEKGVLFGPIISNSPSIGQFTMSVSDEVYGVLYTATVPYRFIGVLQRSVQITQYVESGVRPGDKALGTLLVGGTLMSPRMKLVRVKF